MLAIFYLIILSLHFGRSFDISSVEKCNLKDSECMKKEFSKVCPIFIGGIPEIGVESLDPIILDEVNFFISGLKFSLKDGKVYGLKNTVIDNVIWNSEEKYLEVLHRADLIMEGKYICSGRVIMVPMSGNGQVYSTFTNAAFKWKISYTLEKKSKDKYHVVLKDFDILYEVIDKAFYNLTNLFDGNKAVSEPMLAFINKNWKVVANEFGKPFIKASGSIILRNMQKFFDKYPINDIAIYEP